MFLSLCALPQDWEGNSRYAEYSHFVLGNEQNSYRLFLGNYSGNVGNDALIYHNSTAFSTKDKDNDSCLDKCAQLRKGETGVGRRGDIQVEALRPTGREGANRNFEADIWALVCPFSIGSDCLATFTQAPQTAAV